ncbi:MAG: TIGR02597 family protein [Verrucomicrobia bacterium]|nr:MAG: TIGR02597 family protein [Verrucomicrobiota bacterium]
MKLTYALILAAAASGLASAQTAYTTPVGYVTQTILQNSDTYVGLPLHQAVAYADAASAVTGSVVTITSATPLTASQFAGTYYLKFTSGTALGMWFPVTANTTTTITLNLNGATLSAAAPDTFEVIPFWTLKTLFDPTVSTTDPTTTANAIVASTSTLAGGRRTQLLVPDLVTAGTNLSAASVYYAHSGLWKQPGQGNTDFGNTQLWPDTYFILRHPSTVTSNTAYTISGSVDMAAFNVNLATQAATAQDVAVALPRPVDVTLNQLNLGGTTAFMNSTSTLAGGRRDQLLVFDNTVTAQNKSSAAIYYYHAGLWKQPGQGNTDFGTNTIKAGTGFIIRKYQSGTGATSLWNHTSPY